MASSQRRLPNGRFAKIVNLPEAKAKVTPRSMGGLPIIQIHNEKESAAELRARRRRVSTTLLKDVDKRAAVIQQRLQTAALSAYNKAATGRFARGLRATAIKTGTPDGDVRTVIRVTMQNYRESRFLTNIGGRGWFKQFPIAPYRIFAEGVESELRELGPDRRTNRLKSGRRAISIVKGFNVGRLKVPRRSAFFTAARRPGRGGGESRIINDINGPADFSGPAMEKWAGTLKGITKGGADRAGHFFFYPLWVNHPGFQRDVVSEIAIAEGARFVSQVGASGREAFLSGDIPVAEPKITGTSRVTLSRL